MRPDKKGKKSRKNVPKKEQEEEEEKGDDFNKRNVTSNWTKYELPSSDDEDEENAMTGEDFNEVLRSATGSESMFRLKGEKEWDTFSAQEEMNEFFTLDCKALEEALDAVPVHRLLQFDEELLDPQLINEFDKMAKENAEKFNQKRKAKYQTIRLMTKPHVEEFFYFFKKIFFLKKKNHAQAMKQGANDKSFLMFFVFELFTSVDLFPSSGNPF